MSCLTLTWDDLRERARNHSDLAEHQKLEAITAMNALENILGAQFFDDNRHPLFWFFVDRSSWRFEWAIWFAGLLQSLKTHPDFPSLIHDLLNPKLYEERMTVLEIIAILRPVGFSFRLDSQIGKNGVQKKPDLQVKLDASDPGFFLEVSQLGPSNQERKACTSFRELWGNLFELGSLANCCGHLKRALAPRHIEEVKQEVQAAILKAQNSSGFETLEIPGKIQFAYATEAHAEELNEWAANRDMKPGQLSGPNIDVDEFHRISSKLREKVVQLPSDRANVIVLYPKLFAMPPKSDAELAIFVDALEDLVYEHSHVGYLVLIFTWTGGNDNSVLRYRDHVCVNRLWLYFNCKSILLIKNRFASTPMPPVVEERFLEAFIHSDNRSFESRVQD